MQLLKSYALRKRARKPRTRAAASVLRRQRLQRRTSRTASAGVCVSACNVALRKQVFPRFRSPALRCVGTVHCGFGSVRALAPRLPAAVSRTCTDSAAASSSGVGAAGGKAGATATGGGDGSASGLMKAPVPDRNPRPCIAIAGARRRAPGNGLPEGALPQKHKRNGDAHFAQATQMSARAERRASVGRERARLRKRLAVAGAKAAQGPRHARDAAVVPLGTPAARALRSVLHSRSLPKLFRRKRAAVSAS